jgi:hypothetical protein
VITSRRARHERLSASLAAHRDGDLAALVGTRAEVGVGGGSTVADVEGTPVFVKRIPLTDRELARPHDTANLFDLPVFCQYGVGGPSFNAWRELAANRIVTDAVLAGETAAFPLLHHWRVLPGRAPVAAEHADVHATVALMAGSPAVRTRLEALAAATHSLVLFCEHIPHPVDGWLAEDPEAKADAVERQLAAVVGFLRDRELLHMDGHLGNMRTDGERLYLTDFGLVTSPRFDLTPAERDFVRRNAGHDAGYAAMRLVNWLVTSVCGVTVPPDGVPTARNAYVRRCAAGDIPADVPPDVAAILSRHAPAAARMNAFYWRLFGGDVQAEYPEEQ